MQGICCWRVQKSNAQGYSKVLYCLRASRRGILRLRLIRHPSEGWDPSCAVRATALVGFRLDPGLRRGDGEKGPLASRHRTLTMRRSEEHTSELQSLMRSSYAVVCLKKTNNKLTKESTKYRTNTIIP